MTWFVRHHLHQSHAPGSSALLPPLTRLPKLPAKVAGQSRRPKSPAQVAGPSRRPKSPAQVAGPSRRLSRRPKSPAQVAGQSHRPNSPAKVAGESTYVWDYSQDACTDAMVSLYRGRIKVLTNSTTTFTDGTAIVSRRDKNQVAGLELKETMILCG